MERQIWGPTSRRKTDVSIQQLFPVSPHASDLRPAKFRLAEYGMDLRKTSSPSNSPDDIHASSCGHPDIGKNQRRSRSHSKITGLRVGGAVPTVLRIAAKQRMG
jgi:hypothetical protein